MPNATMCSAMSRVDEEQEEMIDFQRKEIAN